MTSLTICGHTQPRQPRQGRLSSRWCLPLLCLTNFCLAQLVRIEWQGTPWVGHRANKHVRERPIQCRSVGTKTLADPEAESEKLRSAIEKAGSKKLRSTKKLLAILDEAVDGPIFDVFAVSAAYRSLATFKRRKVLKQSRWDSSVIHRLHACVQNMAEQDQLNARGLADVLWSLAQVSDQFSVPIQLLAVLVTLLPSKARDMKPQELSDCFFACSLLKSAALDVREMVPVIAALIPDKVKAMRPQELATCLWASLQLEDFRTDVLLKVVPAVASQIPEKADRMNSQELSNSLVALLSLQDSNPEIASLLAGSQDAGGNFARNAVIRTKILLRKLKKTEWSVNVPAILWACARLGVYDHELLTSVAKHFSSQTKVYLLPHFGLCVLSWSYQILDVQNCFGDFRTLLKSEAARRGFTSEDIQSCRRGYRRWSHAKL